MSVSFAGQSTGSAATSVSGYSASSKSRISHASARSSHADSSAIAPPNRSPNHFYMFALHRHIMTCDWEAAGTDFTGVRETHEDDLPLHIAIYKRAPDTLIIHLIEAYPSAARVKGREGYLPLHWACQMGSTLAIVEALIIEYPNALDIPTSANAVHPSQSPRALARANMNIPLDVKDAVTQSTSLWVRFSVIEKARRDQANKIDRLEHKLALVEDEFAERMGEMHDRFEGYEEDTKVLLKTLMDTIDNLGKEHGDEIELIKDDLNLQQTQTNVSRKASKHFNSDMEQVITSLTERIEKIEKNKKGIF